LFITGNVFNNYIPDTNIKKHNKDDIYIIPDVIVKYSKTIKSRGIFANKEYKKDDIIEICPCIKINKIKISELPLEDYIFYINDNYCMVGFGYCSMYNHSDTPNANWHIMNENQIEIKMLKDIQKGEEIFVSYGDKYWKNRKEKIL